MAAKKNQTVANRRAFVAKAKERGVDAATARKRFFVQTRAKELEAAGKPVDRAALRKKWETGKVNREGFYVKGERERLQRASRGTGNTGNNNGGNNVPNTGNAGGSNNTPGGGTNNRPNTGLPNGTTVTPGPRQTTTTTVTPRGTNTGQTTTTSNNRSGLTAGQKAILGLGALGAVEAAAAAYYGTKIIRRRSQIRFSNERGLPTTTRALGPGPRGLPRGGRGVVGGGGLPPGGSFDLLK